MCNILWEPFCIAKITNANKKWYTRAFSRFSQILWHAKKPRYTVYCACTDELGALGKRWVLAEILHSHHTNMCTKIHKSTVIIMFNKTIKINHKTCLENTMYMLHMWRNKDDTTLNVVQRFKELDSFLLFFLLKIKKLWSSNEEESIRIQIYH